jgi:hypothetical protein
MSYRQKVFYLILISTLLRLLIAGTIEFGNDEVYYYTYALHLQWNYFDHPPGVALLIRLTTLNLWLTNEVFVRLGSIVCAAGGTWISYKTGNLIKNERTGWYAAVLYNASIYTSIIAGTFILPDSPQVVCWLASMLLLIKMLLQLTNEKHIPVWQWLLFALLSGICIQCKVHGIFLWFGFVLYLLFYERKTFLQPWLYISGLVTVFIISPIFWWNVNNHFVTWTYHSNRVAAHSVHININSFLQALLGQLFYNNPVNVFLIIASIYFYKTKKFLQPGIYRLLLLLGLPVIIVVTGISLFNAVLPHWSGPGFLSLTFIAAAYLDHINIATAKALPGILKSSLSLIVIIAIAGMAIINFYPGTIGSKKEKNYGSGDFTLDLSGWKNFKQQYNAWMQQQSDSIDYYQLKIVCNKWFPAAHIEYYIARPMHTQVIGVGNLHDLHNFAWLNKTGRDLKEGDNALCIVPSNYTSDVATTYNNTFSTITKLQTFTALRNNKPTRFFTVYLLKDYKATDEVHTMTIR